MRPPAAHAGGFRRPAGGFGWRPGPFSGKAAAAPPWFSGCRGRRHRRARRLRAGAKRRQACAKTPWNGVEGADELFEKHFVDLEGRAASCPVLQPAEQGAAGQDRIPAARRLPQRIGAQGVVAA